VVAGVLLLCAAALWHQQRQVVVAVVIQPETTVHYGPLEESQRAYTVRDGAELRPGHRQGEWLQVTDAAGRVGWLKRDAVQVLP
jgi:uncharacterized protein YgiM (DUF1202 family)